MSAPAILLLLAAPSTTALEGEAHPHGDRVPRRLEVSFGYAFIPSTGLPLAPGTTGMNVHATYAWQISGLLDGWPAYVGFTAEYTHYPARDAQPSTSRLAYGVHAKHTLWPQERVVPFLDYSLGAGQVWMKGRDGRGIGHLTRLGAGVDLPLFGSIGASIEAAYELIILASLADDPGGESSTRLVHGADLLIGATWSH